MRYAYEPDSFTAHAEAVRELTDVKPRTAYPLPKINSRDDQIPTTIPVAVLRLQEAALEAGWEVRVQFSQGHLPHATTGKAGALRDLLGMKFRAHPMTEAEAHAVYSRSAAGGAWQWGSVWVYGPELPPFGACNITELTHWLMVHGQVADQWYTDIRQRKADRAAMVKTAARKTSSTKRREQGG